MGNSALRWQTLGRGLIGSGCRLGERDDVAIVQRGATAIATACRTPGSGLDVSGGRCLVCPGSGAADTGQLSDHPCARVVLTVGEAGARVGAGERSSMVDARKVEAYRFPCLQIRTIWQRSDGSAPCHRPVLARVASRVRVLSQSRAGPRRDDTSLVSQTTIGRHFESDPAGAPRRYENPRHADDDSIRHHWRAMLRILLARQCVVHVDRVGGPRLVMPTSE